MSKSSGESPRESDALRRSSSAVEDVTVRVPVQFGSIEEAAQFVSGAIQDAMIRCQYAGNPFVIFRDPSTGKLYAHDGTGISEYSGVRPHGVVNSRAIIKHARVSGLNDDRGILTVSLDLGGRNPADIIDIEKGAREFYRIGQKVSLTLEVEP